MNKNLDEYIGVGIAFEESVGWYNCIKFTDKTSVKTDGKFYKTREEAEQNSQDFYNLIVELIKKEYGDIKISTYKMN